YPLGLKQQRHQTRDGSPRPRPHPRSRPRPPPRPRSPPRAPHRCVIRGLSTENPHNATVEPPNAPKRPHTTLGLPPSPSRFHTPPNAPKRPWACPQVVDG